VMQMGVGSQRGCRKELGMVPVLSFGTIGG